MPFDRHTNNLIADLRGLPRDEGRSIQRAAQPLGGLLEVALKNYRIGENRVEETIAREWKQIVGPKWAHRCAPVRILGARKLLVFAANSIVRQELLFRKNEILAKLKRLPGCEDLAEVKIQQG